MALQAVLAATTLRTLQKPIVTAQCQFVMPGGDGPRLTQVTDPRARAAHRLRSLGAGAQTGPGSVGKMTKCYMTTGASVFVLVSVGIRLPKDGKMHKRSMLFECAPTFDSGSVRMRLPGGLVTLLSSPMRRVREDEACQLMGSLYNVEQEYRDADYARFGVILKGMTQTAAPAAVKTVGEHGEDKTVYIARNPRRVKL